jgi:cytochrome c-type biogenesis protein CcmF
MSDDSFPVALVQLVRRNRRRYGGYLVHLGIATLFVGVAASSAFQQARDVELSKGQSVKVGHYDVRYVDTTADMIKAPSGMLERIDFGARLELRKDGKLVERMVTKRSYFMSMDPSLGPISRFFEGEATSEVALRAGLWNDVWTVISPDLEKLRPIIEEGDKVFTAARALPDEQRLPMLAEALRALTQRYADEPPPATFRILVSPLVTWIWLGALIAFGGGVVAGWPTGASARRTVTAGYAARLARDLGRV